MAKFDFKGNKIRQDGHHTPSDPPGPYVMADFLGISLASHDDLVTVTQSGTPTTSAAISATAGDPVAGYGGWLAGSVDNVDAEVDEVAVGGLAATASWLRADQVGKGRLICEWAVDSPGVLTARTFFAGLSDDPTEGTGTQGPMSISGTTVIADTATDAAGWMLSSLATDADGWHYGATDGGTQDAATSAFTATADTWTGLRTEVDVNGDCYFFYRTSRGGELTFAGKSTNGTSPDVLLVPVFAAGATANTAVAWEIDYAFASAVIW